MPVLRNLMWICLTGLLLAFVAVSRDGSVVRAAADMLDESRAAAGGG